MADLAHSHWAASYIGRSYDSIGRCWGLCRLVWGERFGLPDVPDVDVDDDDPVAVRRAFRDFGVGKRIGAVRIEQPVEGAAVYLVRARLPDHVGVWVDADRGGVLHALKSDGVIFTKASALRTSGFRIGGIYLPKGFPCRSATS